MKECYSVQTAEYAVSKDCDSKPAFSWWVTHVLKKRGRIISEVKLCQKKFVKTTEKCDIELPCNADHAKALGARNDSTL